MKQEHQEIILALSEYLAENPNIRFTQALVNLGINELVNGSDGTVFISDNFYEDDANVLKRVNTNKLVRCQWCKQLKPPTYFKNSDLCITCKQNATSYP
jgi:hypothetical protein